MRRIIGTILATAGLLLAVTGCSGDDQGGEKKPTTPQGVLTAYFAAIDNGDTGACDFELPSFTDQSNAAAGKAAGNGEVTCEDRIDARHAEVKDAEEGLADSKFEVTQESQAQAMIEVTYPGEETVAAYYLLVPEDDTWLVSDVRVPQD